MSWSPPWVRGHLGSLGALDTTPVARDFLSKLIPELRRYGVLERYSMEFGSLGRRPAYEAALHRMTHAAFAVADRDELPYLVAFVPAGPRAIGPSGSTFRRTRKSQQYVNLVVKVPENLFQSYDALSRGLVGTLGHEFQHVIQALARPVGERVLYQRLPRGSIERDRMYFAAPSEVPAFAVTIANQLRARGISRIGFPASEEARQASPQLSRVYGIFDLADPGDAKVLKNYTIRIGKIL